MNQIDLLYLFFWPLTLRLVFSVIRFYLLRQLKDACLRLVRKLEFHLFLKWPVFACSHFPLLLVLHRWLWVPYHNIPGTFSWCSSGTARKKLVNVYACWYCSHFTKPCWYVGLLCPSCIVLSLSCFLFKLMWWECASCFWMFSL